MPNEVYVGTRYRGSQEAVFGFARETALLSPTATSMGGIPALQHAGYYDVAGIDSSENSSLITTAGTYRGIQLTKGRREATFRNNLRIGNAESLKFAVRNSGWASTGGQYKCLPLVAVGGGAVGDCLPSNDGTTFGWVGRYGMVREVSMSFQDGPAQPITASVEVWPLALQTDAAATTALATLVNGTIDQREAAMRAAGGGILMWHHVSWLISNGDGTFTDYRNLVASLSISITNNIERIGTRKDVIAGDAGASAGVGDANDLSRVPVIMLPLEETVSIQMQLHDKLPAAFVNAANDSNLWGEIRVVASDGQKTLTVRIAESRLQRQGMNGVGPNSVLRFSAAAASRVVELTVTNTGNGGGGTSNEPTIVGG